MRPEERLEIARVAYQRALALARAHSTPSSWRRALAASRNLGAAIRDRDPAQRPHAQAASARRDAPAAGGSRIAPAAHGRPPAGTGSQRHARLDRQRRAAALSTARAVCEGIRAELERARALMEQSRRLVREARSLRDELAGLIVTRPAASDAASP